MTRKQVNLDEDAYDLLDEYRKTLVPEDVEPPSFTAAIKHLLKKKKK